MSFTPNIPASGQSLGNSRLQVLNNFATLRTAAGSDVTATGDHFDVNGSNIGKHKWVHLPAVNLGPSVGNPTTGSQEGAVFTRNTASNPAVNMFYVSENTGNIWQMTTKREANYATFGISWTFLPGGLIMAFGKVTGNPVANGTAITFPVGLFSTEIYSVTLGSTTASTSDKTINITFGSVSITGFTLITSGTSSFRAVHWMAIGY